MRPWESILWILAAWRRTISKTRCKRCWLATSSRYIAFLEYLLDLHHGQPDYWAKDVRSMIENFKDFIRIGSPAVPRELSVPSRAEQAKESLQAPGARFRRAPAVVAGDLRRRGQAPRKRRYTWPSRSEARRAGGRSGQPQPSALGSFRIRLANEVTYFTIIYGQARSTEGAREWHLKEAPCL